MPEERRSQLLRAIIEAYAATGIPVASQHLVECYQLPFSPATVRNDMAELESDGYLLQPHTSAGRIPTEKAYLYYVRNLLSAPQLSPQNQARLADSAHSDRPEDWANVLAEVVQRAVIVADVAVEHVSYSGIAHVLMQKELQSQAAAHTLGLLLDHLPEAVAFAQRQASDDVQWLIGTQNPFGHEFVTAITRYHTADSSGVLLLFSPLRLDYRLCVGAIEYLKLLVDQPRS